MAENTSLQPKSGGKDLPSKEETRTQEWFVRPAVDIFETPEGLTVVADLPGVTGAGLSIRVEEGILSLEARPQVEQASSYAIQEFRMTNFYRQFSLPEEVDQERISAEMKNGVLFLSLPRAEKAKPRRVEVKLS